MTVSAPSAAWPGPDLAPLCERSLGPPAGPGRSAQQLPPLPGAPRPEPKAGATGGYPPRGAPAAGVDPRSRPGGPARPSDTLGTAGGGNAWGVRPAEPPPLVLMGVGSVGAGGPRPARAGCCSLPVALGSVFKTFRKFCQSDGPPFRMRETDPAPRPPPAQATADTRAANAARGSSPVRTRPPPSALSQIPVPLPRPSRLAICDTALSTRRGPWGRGGAPAGHLRAAARALDGALPRDDAPQRSKSPGGGGCRRPWGGTEKGGRGQGSWLCLHSFIHPSAHSFIRHRSPWPLVSVARRVKPLRPPSVYQG